MGSTLERPAGFRFDIAIEDSRDKITKIDIVKDGGAVVADYTPAAANSVRWKPGVRDETAHYFLVRVWTARGGDAPNADPGQPVAWLAPVWTGR
jgi:hypothetical protein